jgi:hypothetical protein
MWPSTVEPDEVFGGDARDADSLFSRRTRIAVTERDAVKGHRVRSIRKIGSQSDLEPIL